MTTTTEITVITTMTTVGSRLKGDASLISAHSLAPAVGANTVISKFDGLGGLVERVRVVLNYNWECSAARAVH